MATHAAARASGEDHTCNHFSRAFNSS
jgi:hypothetical protein